MSTLSLHPPAKESPAEIDLQQELLGNSAAMQRLRTQLQRLGPHFRTVLLSGERGTGKELAARALHRFSSHAAGPFVMLRCAGKDELRSAMKAAHRGTLYLEQIDGATAESQSQLLASIMSRERLQRGRIVVHGLEARIIASTTEDLRVLAASGRFRQELFARLAPVEIELPPLRERTEDIPLLAVHFVTLHAQQFGQGVPEISNEALEQLQGYRWPGNVRELMDQMQRAAALSDGGGIRTEHLALQAPAETEASGMRNGPARLQEVVEQHVFQVLKGCAGNKVKAAELLGISRSTLYRMLEAGLQAERIVGLR